MAFQWHYFFIATGWAILSRRGKSRGVFLDFFLRLPDFQFSWGFVLSRIFSTQQCFFQNLPDFFQNTRIFFQSQKFFLRPNVMKVEAKAWRGDPRPPRAQARPRVKVIYKHLIRAVNCCLSARAVLRSVSAGGFGGGVGRSGAHRRRRRGGAPQQQREIIHAAKRVDTGKHTHITATLKSKAMTLRADCIETDATPRKKIKNAPPKIGGRKKTK